MVSDFWIVLRWWGTLFLVGAAAFPLTKRLFGSWHMHGYAFAKAVGMSVVGWLVLVLGMGRVAPFTVLTITIALVGMFIFGLVVYRASSVAGRQQAQPLWTYIGQEMFFLIALFFWAWVKGHEPSVRGLEKFMDYGFMNSILHSTYFPAVDMWYPPEYINYYYFGHLVTAFLTKLSGLDLAYTFNLMLATIFACTLTMSFSIGFQLWRAVSIKRALFSGILTAFLVTLAGNMQTLYAFTRGYTGEDVKPFWQLAWPVSEFMARLPEGLELYWYANATRFIPYAIHEFPSYSFVVSDVHGHVLSIPFVLLAIGLLITFFSGTRDSVVHAKTFWRGPLTPLAVIFYGFLVGVLVMTNALDGPIYLGLFVAAILIAGVHVGKNWKSWALPVGVATIAAVTSSLPFLSHFKSFVNGIALNCPPQFLANTKVGILLFEGVEKCQRSPLWMLWMLWGFFWFCCIYWIGTKIAVYKKQNKTSLWHRFSDVWSNEFTQLEKLLIIFFGISLALIVFPEFFYFKDIYPQHFRSNTMFKLGYQAFILYSIVSAYGVTFLVLAPRAIISRWSKALFMVFLLPQLFLVSIYPIFSVRSYFNSLRNYEGPYGLTWLAEQYPDDYAGILWLNNEIRSPAWRMQRGEATGLPGIVEADGDSYTDYQRYSVFTGMPTPIGWAVHEWLWRGNYDIVSPRREDVRVIYESDDTERTGELLDTYNVRYIVVGALEREKFTELSEDKFNVLATLVFTQGTTTIYERKANR